MILKLTVYHGNFVDTPSLGDVRIRPQTTIGVGTDGKILFIKEKSQDPLRDALDLIRLSSHRRLPLLKFQAAKTAHSSSPDLSTHTYMRRSIPTQGSLVHRHCWTGCRRTRSRSRRRSRTQTQRGRCTTGFWTGPWPTAPLQPRITPLSTPRLRT